VTSITVRDVPKAVRDQLAARAARAGRSLQEYLRIELTELANRPSADEWLSRVREHKVVTGADFTIEEILANRDADRDRR
jgi:plasmid stability protein